MRMDCKPPCLMSESKSLVVYRASTMLLRAIASVREQINRILSHHDECCH